MAAKGRYVLMNNGVEYARRPAKKTLQNMAIKDNLKRTPPGQRAVVYIEDTHTGARTEFRHGGWFENHA